MSPRSLPRTDDDALATASLLLNKLTDGALSIATDEASDPLAAVDAIDEVALHLERGTPQDLRTFLLAVAIELHSRSSTLHSNS